MAVAITNSSLPLDRVIVGDTLKVLPRLPDGAVDLVFADPPYNLQLKSDLARPDQSIVAGVDDDWDKIGDFAAYDRFSRSWLTECQRILKPDGTLWVIGTYHNIFRLGAALQDLGFWILNDVIWSKTNPMPNFRGRRFTNAHETLIWAARSPEAKHRFNYTAAKVANDDVQMRSDWSMPLCTGTERLKRGGRKLHPTQKPEALLHRVLLTASKPGQIVLDPFFGTGTTGAVARRLRRHWIGIERDRDYAKAARHRIKQIDPVDDDSLVVSIDKRDEPKIPFGHLVERGLVHPGETLFDPSRRFAARVRVDGSLIAGDVRGSIHQVAAAVQHLPACNGWAFWCVERDGQPVPIDTLRQRARHEQSQRS